MLKLILDLVNEYQEATKDRKWIGNERLTEMERDFDKLLERIIDARITAKVRSNKLYK